MSRPRVPALWDPSTIAIDRREPSVFGTLTPAAPQPCRLVLYSGTAAGRSFALAEGSNIIGRSPDVQVQVASPGLSRRHAEIVVAGDAATLHDLGSVNGSFHNDRRVDCETPLGEGDMVRLGSVLLKFYRRLSLEALMHDRLYRQATLDAGTGVYNRRWFGEALQSEFAQAQRAGWPLALIVLDLDHFKAVNDRFGHGGGDIVLEKCAGAALQAVQGAGTLARVGGEEFAVLLPRCSAAQARAVAERIRAAVEALDLVLPLADEQGPRTAGHRQTVSLGLAELSPAMPLPLDLAEAADRQLYLAKEAGRNRVSG